MKKLSKKLLTLLFCLLSTVAVGGFAACENDGGNNEDINGGQTNDNNGDNNTDDTTDGAGDNNGDNAGGTTGEEKQSYTVAFDTDGGSEVASQTVKEGEKVVRPQDPQKEDYTFIGWYSGNVKWSFTDGVVSQNMTLKAVWAPAQCTITLEKNIEEGGKVSGEGTFAYGESKTIKAETSIGYTFLGWYKGEEKISDSLKFTFKVKEDVTYTAKWKASSIKVTQNDVAAGTVDGPIKSVSGGKVKITATTNQGYTFLGWYVGEEFITAEEVYEFTLSDEAAVTYTAKWTAYTLTTESDFSIAGTYSLYSEEKITAGENVTLTVTPNTNYTFLGWYDGDEKLSQNVSYTFAMPKESVTYTAKWQDDWKQIEGYNYWTFEQLGKQVMPIVGFNTPNASSADLGRTEGLPSQISLESYQMMKDCGFNVACGWWNDWKTYNVQDDVLKELDYADQVGMVYIVNDRSALYATTASSLSAFTQYMSKPAYGGTILIDEPGAVNFADIAKATRAWEASEYKNTLAYVNNLPKYAGMGQLKDAQNTGGTYEGTFSNYEEWVQLYLNTVKPQVFSYDFYPYVFNTSDWFTNLSNVRYYTAKANVPYWVYGQVGVWAQAGVDLTQKLSYAQTAFQYNTMLAYGAKGIQYYNYFTPPNYGDVNGNTACVTLNGEKTVYYDYVQKINKQVAAVDQVLLMSKWQGIIPINNSQYPLSSGDYVSAYGALTSATGVGDAIVGCFEYRDIGYAYYVASNNVSTGATVTLNFDGTYNLTKVQEAIQTQSSGNSITLSIPAGEGVLVVVPKN